MVRRMVMKTDDNKLRTAKKAFAEDPTPASMWYALTGSPLTDEILEWPADLFALTNIILKRTEAYRFVLSPPCGTAWPPKRLASWSEAVEETSRQWSVWLEDRDAALPELLVEEWTAFRERAGIAFEDVAEGRDWRMCEALLTLHAIADEACAGLGMGFDKSDGKGCLYRARGREVLATTGSLARLPSHVLRVLPKVCTPPNGTCFRSFSRYVCVQGPGLEARWHKVPVRRSGTELQARHANLLLLPWPLRVRESDFRPVAVSDQILEIERCGFFEFAPSEKLDLDLVSRMIVAARDEVDSVDGVLLPESAVEDSEVENLEALLDRHGVAMLMTGVRQGSPGPGRFPSNWVHIGANPRLKKGASIPDTNGGQWFHIRQNKNHRWSLDEGQILQYHLGGVLHPHLRWWEAMDVPRRTVHFVEHGDNIVIVSLVCEDLAQIDSVVEMIRAVGPTVVYTPLLDGPQLSSRWAARYASVLADDPGSAVLTLTSFGMVQRSRPDLREASPVVALWKDPVRGVREIPLEAGAQGVLLTLCGGRGTRRSSDGRQPVDNVTEQFDVAVHQVRASSAGSLRSNSQSDPRPPRLLDADELTILTGWTQALAEALEHATGSVETLFANARPGAPWRKAFKLAEPSPRLAEAIGCMARAVRDVSRSEGVPKVTIPADGQQRESNEHGLDALVRRVLQSILEQRTR
jgi:hypothetical protein